MLKIANVRENKELEKRVVRKVKNEDVLIVILIMEKKVVK